jgi:hypothetical protein
MGYADIYELQGSVNFHEVCRAMGVRWRSFFGALRAKKEVRFKPWQRVPIIVVRFMR